MDFEAKVQFSDMLFAQEIDGEIVLLDMRTEHYFGLDSVAADIWKQLQSGKSIGETCKVIMDEYDIDEATLHKDVEAFIGTLLHSGLVTLD